LVKVEWTERAIKDFEKLGEPIAQGILKKVD